MTRVVSVGRSKSLFIAGALGITFFAIALTGCPGTLADPSAFPGGAGTSGAAGTGAAGTGAAGTGAAGTGSTCDMSKLINTTYSCTLNGACHDANGTAAGLSLVDANWPQLVGQPPKGGGAGALASICFADPTFKTMPYIVSKSNPATGLLVTKIMADTCSPGGKRMPNLGVNLSAADLVCFQQWATQLANQ